MSVYCSLACVGIEPAEWDARAPTVFQSWDWLTTWWDVFGRGELVITVNDGAIAPWFLDGGMLYQVGASNSDYLEVLSDGPLSDVALAGVIGEALAASDADGMIMYLVPEGSPTAAALPGVADRLGMELVALDEIGASWLALHDRSVVDRRSLRRADRSLRSRGDVAVDHHRGRAAQPWLEAFFEQHVARWAGVDGIDSPYVDPAQRRFVEALVARDPQWLRFTTVRCDGELAAAHLGMTFLGRALWYKPSFDIVLAAHSPGVVLLRHLLAAAIDEGCDCFDFGIGDEAFKRRYAVQRRVVRSYGLYR